jgi:hypothetical protein
MKYYTGEEIRLGDEVRVLLVGQYIEGIVCHIPGVGYDTADLKRYFAQGFKNVLVRRKNKDTQNLSAGEIPDDLPPYIGVLDPEDEGELIFVRRAQ